MVTSALGIRIHFWGEVFINIHTFLPQWKEHADEKKLNRGEIETDRLPHPYTDT